MEGQNYKIDINQIKPRNVKKSDKYSKAIYKYLKNNPQFRRVWFDESFYDTGSHGWVKRKFNANDIDFANLFFGIPEGDDSICISGKCIQSLIAGGRGSQETFCYIGNENSHYVEVTKEFFDRYIEIGRCIYGHGLYLKNDDNRYTYLNEKHRKCNWCGREECLVTEAHQYTRDVWKPKEQ